MKPSSFELPLRSSLEAEMWSAEREEVWTRVYRRHTERMLENRTVIAASRAKLDLAMIPVRVAAVGSVVERLSYLVRPSLYVMLALLVIIFVAQAVTWLSGRSHEDG